MTHRDFEEMQEKIRIFQMSDCDWYAAETVDSAIELYAKDLGYKTSGEYLLDNPDDVIFPLNDEQMKTFGFIEDGEDGSPRKGERKTFRQKLDELIVKGEKFPLFFASTEY